MKPARFVWLDGALVPWGEASVHVLTHALAHGTGVFEGIRSHPTDDGPSIFRLDDHVARLFRSARTMLMDIPWRPDALADAAARLVRVNEQESSYLRMIAFRAFGEMFVNPRGNPVSVVIASWEQPYSFADPAFANGVRLMISSWRRPDANAVPSGAKLTGAYATAGLARMEAEAAGYDDAIMLGPSGTVAEAVIANVFVVRRECLFTPPIADGPLPGITRETVMTLAAQLGLECREARLTRLELYGADEVFLTGTGVGITPVCEIDSRPYLSPGPVTAALQEEYRRAIAGSSAAFVHWLTPVNLPTTADALGLEQVV